MDYSFLKIPEDIEASGTFNSENQNFGILQYYFLTLFAEALVLVNTKC